MSDADYAAVLIRAAIAVLTLIVIGLHCAFPSQYPWQQTAALLAVLIWSGTFRVGR